MGLCWGVVGILLNVWAVCHFARSHASVLPFVGKKALTFTKKELRKELKALHKEGNETMWGSMLADKVIRKALALPKLAPFIVQPLPMVVAT